jgi:hypothetical protein
MYKLKTLTISIILLMLLSLAGPSFVSASPLAAISPTLGAAASYSVLAGQTVTNTGSSTIVGDVGVSPGSAITGFPPGIVGPPGTIHAADANAAAAQIDSAAAFTFLNSQACDTTYPGTKDLVGENLVSGVYCADAFTLSGTLTLSGVGVWIFKSAASFITSGTANIVGGDPCNVWWSVVSSATLGTNTSLTGNILASTSIILQTGANLNGRALAQTGAVTLDNNVITGSACLAPPAATATVTTTPGPSATPGLGTPSATPGLETPTDTPIPPRTTPIHGLPPTGGAPIRNESFPWSLVIVTVFSAIALFLGVRAYRRTLLSKK